MRPRWTATSGRGHTRGVHEPRIDAARRSTSTPDRGPLLFLLGTVLFLASGSPACCQEFDASSASLDDLLFHAQRYATTPEKAERKRAAREEFQSRGAESLRYLMSRIHIENIWIYLLAEEVRRELEADVAVPVLLEFLDAEHDRTRRLAVFFLGEHDTPQYADRLLPLLDDDEAAGSAVRTLGKWHVTNAVPRIVPFLGDEKERRRVVAANALGSIGDASAVPALIEALADPFFTVRKAAARALVNVGDGATDELVAALGEVRGPALRELVAVAGELKLEAAGDQLTRLQTVNDGSLHRDVARALLLIYPRRGDAGGRSGPSPAGSGKMAPELRE